MWISSSPARWRFPMTFPRELRGAEGAVAVGSQSCAASLSIRHRRLRRPPAEHRQLREFGVEIDDARRSRRIAPCRVGVCSSEGRRHRARCGRRGRRRAQCVLPSAERKRCHAPCGMTAIIPARSAKDLGGPSSQTISRVAAAVENVNQLVLGMGSQWSVPRTCREAGARHGKRPIARRCPLRSARVVCGVSPRNIVSFASFCVEIDDARHSALHGSRRLLPVRRARQRSATI